jgi:hypothetical protein
LYKIRARKDAAGDFFRAVQAKKNQYQGFWIVSPAGEVLAAHHEYKSEKSWTNEVLAAVEQGLSRAGPLRPRHVEPRELLPWRGKGIQEEGRVSLALCVRQMSRGKPAGQGVFDTLDLSAREWKEFAPPEPTAGTKWRLAPALASKFTRCLSGLSDQSTMPRPEEATEVEFSATVEEVRSGIAIITYEGRLAAVHAHPFEKGRTNNTQARLVGIATYDIAAAEMRYLLMYGTGTYRHFQPYDREVTPLGIVVDWQRRGGPNQSGK